MGDVIVVLPLRNNENNNNNNNHNAAAFHKQVVLPLYHVHITLPHIHRNIYDAQRSVEREEVLLLLQ